MKSPNLLAGCVVLYNPAEYILDNIKSYIDCIEVLFVIDNSEQVSNTLIEKLLSLSSKVEYLPQGENIGIASALNLASEYAANKSFNWLLTMDQDSYFLNSEFFNLWENESNKQQVGLFAASYTKKYDQWQKNYSNNYNEIHYAITSGNIINLDAWKKVNRFEDKLFIDEVDHDFCLKLRNRKYKILVSKEIYLEHEIGHFNLNGVETTDTRKPINLHNALRYYYISRNVLYVCKKYFFIDYKFAFSRFYYLIKGFTKIVFLYPNKLIYLRYFALGIKDFTISRFYKFKE